MPNSPYSQSLSLSHVQAPVIKQEAEPTYYQQKNPIREMRELLLSDSYAEKTKSVDRFYRSFHVI